MSLNPLLFLVISTSGIQTLGWTISSGILIKEDPSTYDLLWSNTTFLRNVAPFQWKQCWFVFIGVKENAHLSWAELALSHHESRCTRHMYFLPDWIKTNHMLITQAACASFYEHYHMQLSLTDCLKGNYRLFLQTVYMMSEQGLQTSQCYETQSFRVAMSECGRPFTYL